MGRGQLTSPTGGQFVTFVQGGSFFECPRWHDGRWYVSDFYRHMVLEISVDGQETPHLELGDQPSGLGWLPDGSLLVVSKNERRILRRAQSGEITTHADLSDDVHTPLNDMVVSASGHAYVGEFGFDTMVPEDPAYAGLYHVAPDGTVTKEADDLGFPNGSVITPDGKTLIVGESIACRYRAFDIGDDGSLSNARVWGQIAPAPPFTSGAQFLASLPMAVDGCALDAEGHIWVADAFGARLMRVAPGGAIVEEVAAPEGMGFIACALGGEGRRTLLIAAGPLEWNEAIRSQTRDSVLLTMQVDVPGAGLP
jgi:sugar lactone lactonase YvrE